MTVRELLQGEYFTLKEIAEPKENQVWVRGEYDRSAKGYVCTNFADIGKSRILKAEKVVYVNFCF